MGRIVSRVLAGVGGALALAAAGPAAAAAQGPPANITLTGGHADWGLKQSFRNYIGSPIAHGTVTASDGATKNADGTFRFTLVSGTYKLANHGVTAQYDGTVRFTGHDSGAGPLLDLTISDPKLETDGDTGKLYLDARSKSMATGQFEDFDDVHFADLDLADSDVVPGRQVVSISPIAAVLTADGAAAFAGFYSAGTALDAFGTTVSYAPPAPPPPAIREEVVPEPTPVEPEIRVAAARLTGLERPWNRKGKAAIARVVCRASSCDIDTQRRVRFQVDGDRYHPRVIAPKRLAQGERGTIRIQLSRKALAALSGGGRATSSLPLMVQSGDQRDFDVVRFTLRGSGVTVTG